MKKNLLISWVNVLLLFPVIIFLIPVVIIGKTSLFIAHKTSKLIAE